MKMQFLNVWEVQFEKDTVVDIHLYYLCIFIDLNYQRPNRNMLWNFFTL